MSEKMKRGHTPTPWELKPEEIDKPYIRIRGTALGRRYKIANVLMPVYKGSHEYEIEETRANAAFIVRAVNAHDELVRKIKELINRLETIKETHRDLSLSDDISQAKKVLTKANGGA